MDLIEILKQLKQSPCMPLELKDEEKIKVLEEAGLLSRFKVTDSEQKVWYLENIMTQHFLEQTELNIKMQSEQEVRSQLDQTENKTEAGSQNASPQKLDKSAKCDKSKQELAQKIYQLQQELVQTQQKLSNDQKYIRLLHDYNYLKDAAFQLVETVALISKVSAKQIFDDFEVRDTEHCWIKK